jgi:hypothetical protein
LEPSFGLTGSLIRAGLHSSAIVAFIDNLGTAEKFAENAAQRAVIA